MSDRILYLSFIAASLAYGTASVAFLVFVGSGNELSRRIASRALLGAACLHFVFVIRDAASQGTVANVSQMLTMVSLAIVATHLAALRYGKLPALGVFVTPVALIMFLAAGLGHSVPAVPENVRSALLPIHVVVNILGVTAFTLAFAVATAYLVQERLLRKRKLTGLFTRLPPLDVLDSLGLKLLLVGFPLFTIGTISGAVWASKLPHGPSATQVLGLVAWAIFGAVLLLRVAAGWQGRRAAIGTLLGFACALAVVAGYVVRASSGVL